MVKNNPEPTSTIQQFVNQDLLSVYEQVNEIQRYEGSGIWSRFNILVSLNIVLFGAVTFLLNSKIPNAVNLIKVLCIAGCLMSIWSVYVLQRLWLWHVHWKKTLQKIEAFFPKDIPKPFTDRPRRLQKKSSWFQNWLLAYTQPFMLVFFFIWIILSALSISGNLYTAKEEKKQVEPVKYIEIIRQQRCCDYHGIQ